MRKKENKEKKRKEGKVILIRKRGRKKVTEAWSLKLQTKFQNYWFLESFPNKKNKTEFVKAINIFYTVSKLNWCQLDADWEIRYYSTVWQIFQTTRLRIRRICFFSKLFTEISPDTSMGT